MKKKSHQKLDILFWITILCTFLPTYLAKGIASVNDLIPDFTKHMWIYYLFTPISLLSMFLGIKYKKMGYSCTKNIISGVIITIILIFLGSFSFLFYDYESENYNQIITLGEKLQINFPESGKCTIQTENMVYENYHISSYGLAIFTSREVEQFEGEISNDPRWLKNIDENLETLKTGISLESGDYHLFYNEKLNTYNELPVARGVYKIYYLSYDVEQHILLITTYDITITT